MSLAGVLKQFSYENDTKGFCQCCLTRVKNITFPIAPTGSRLEESAGITNDQPSCECVSLSTFQIFCKKEKKEKRKSALGAKLMTKHLRN